MSDERTALLTGFAPFGGREANASWAAVQQVARSWQRPERLVVEQLPVSFLAARRRLRALVDSTGPDVVVCVGEAGRERVGVERVALNLLDARIPDEDGSQPVDVPVVAGAPMALLATLPVKAAVRAVADAGVPVELSHTAGTYVCNATFYALLHAVAGSAVRAGFVHVPLGLADEDVAASARAVAAVVVTALDRGPEDDLRVPLGSLG